jgi:cation transporter-like permease
MLAVVLYTLSAWMPEATGLQMPAAPLGAMNKSGRQKGDIDDDPPSDGGKMEQHAASLLEELSTKPWHAQEFARIRQTMDSSPNYTKELLDKLGDRKMTFKEFLDVIQQTPSIEVQKHNLVPALSAQSVWRESRSRATLLLLLMMLQSGSALVLGRYEALLKEHVIVMLFLTMLVGAGGNVGNQSVIKVIKLLVSGELHANMVSVWEILYEQTEVGLILAVILGIGGFARASATQYCFRPAGEDRAKALKGCIAVSAALMVIVILSAILGTILPLSLAAMGLDVAYAGPTIQVIMDIGGVIITCTIACLILDRLPTRSTSNHKVPEQGLQV